MADQIQLADLMRRAVEANVQYFTTLSKLAVEYLETVLGSVANLTPQPASNGGSPASDETIDVDVPAAPAPPGPTILLEAEAGGHALGVLLVENVLAEAVSARIVVSPFVDSSGREARTAIRVDPETISLEPKEQVLVRLVAAIDDSLIPGADYRAEVSVPDLPGTCVPLVLRRRATAALAAPAPAKKPAATGKARAPSGRGASRGRSKKKKA